MASGVSVSDECQQAFEEVKLGHKHRFVIFSLNAGQDTIVVEKKVTKDHVDAALSPEARYARFLKLLTDKEATGDCCYAVYDAEYVRKSNGQQRSKIIFVVWCPDTASVKKKMLYASSKDYLRRLFVGVAGEVQATEPEEVGWAQVMDKLERLEATN